MTALFTDTVITREVEWLSTTNDSLPALIKTDMQDGSAPFDVIAGYWPRQPGNVRAVYVMRTGIAPFELDQGHLMPRHTIRLRVWWPIQNGDLQQVQCDLDAALELLCQRIVGLRGDRTHGQRFQAAGVADRPGGQAFAVAFDPAERADGQLNAYVTYTIDDAEVIA